MANRVKVKCEISHPNQFYFNNTNNNNQALHHNKTTIPLTMQCMNKYICYNPLITIVAQLKLQYRVASLHYTLTLHNTPNKTFSSKFICQMFG